MDREYAFDSSSDLGAEGLAYMEALFDPPTRSFLEDVGVRPAWRCLELGAGGGSIARWLADRTGPAGRVVAVDIDTAHVRMHQGVEVYRHDISDGLPVDSTFDLIHARNVLMHVTRREQVLRTLIDALSPGGWLVLAEVANRPQRVLSAPSEADAELVARIVDTGMEKVGPQAGISWEWAHEVEAQMAAAGLVDLRGLEYCRMLCGGNTACLLNGNYLRQLEPAMLQLGISPEELERFHELMRDPRFRAWPFLQLVFTAGQKPLQ